MKLLLFLLLFFCGVEFPLRGLGGFEAYAQPTHPPLDSATLAQKAKYTSIEKALKEPLEVYKLDLSEQGLKEFPKEIFQFLNLQVLKCFGNKFTNLPAEIGRLTNLEILQLGDGSGAGNKLTNLPPEIGQLQNLTILDCSYNQIRSFPTEIGQLKNLTFLGCDRNKLTYLPAEIGQLQNLKYLAFHYNLLTGLPPEIGQLKNLEILEFDRNKLTSLPAEIGQLKRLKELGCHYNQITSLPPETGQLESLTHLICAGNKLTTLPPEIGQLKNLRYIFCNNNQLTSIAPEIGRIKSLIRLDCENNPLTNLPEDVPLLEKITWITLGNRQKKLTQLPERVRKMVSLEYLDASGDSLLTFPTEVLKLTNLSELRLTANPFTTIPNDINKLENLVQLHLDSLKIDVLPIEIQQLSKLEKFNLMGTTIATPVDKQLYSFLKKFAFGGNVAIALQVGASLEEQTNNAKIALIQADTFRKEAEKEKDKAEKGKDKAEKAEGEAQKEKERAEIAKKEAQKDKMRAEQNETQAKRAEREAHKAEQNAQNQRNIAFGVGIVAVLLGVFALYQMSVAHKQRKLADIEKAKSEKLLLNILPEEVASELKEKGITEVKHFDHASILFADVKGFSALASKVTPKELIAELDATFTKMDEISMANGLERIKTIGDCYMAVAGVPHPSPTNPLDIILAALGIQKWMNDERQARGGNFWQVRLGTHTGELVAGVIGKTKFAYDVWGSAVNLASRMESGGEVGRVNTTEYTKDLINDFFEFTFRGELEAKNIGLVNAYFVDRIKPELSADADGFVPNEQFYQLKKERFGV